HGRAAGRVDRQGDRLHPALAERLVERPREPRERQAGTQRRRQPDDARKAHHRDDRHNAPPPAWRDGAQPSLQTCPVRLRICRLASQAHVMAHKSVRSHAQVTYSLPARRLLSGTLFAAAVLNNGRHTTPAIEWDQMHMLMKLFILTVLMS